MASGNQKVSLRDTAVEIQETHGLQMRKQSIDGRFNEGAVQFMKELVAKQVSKQITSTLPVDIFKKFNRVRICDSTRFEIDEEFEKEFPGSGGSASAAALCIQFEFDIKAGRVMDMEVGCGNQSDNKYAQRKASNIEAGDLILRDLGYVSIPNIISAIKSFAFVVFRLNPTTKVYQQNQGEMQELSFGELYKHMCRCKLERMEKQVFIGMKEKLAMRLII